MNNLKLKLKHILLPHICISVGVTLAYLLFYFIVVIKIEADIKDNLTGFIIPGVIAAVANLIWLRPGVKRLIFKNDRIYSLYYILAIGVNMWLMVVSVCLLKLKSNDVVNLKNIYEIESKARSTFYTIDDFNIIDRYGSSTFTVNRSGKNNEHIDFNVYFVAPIAKKNESINIDAKHKYWVVQCYDTRESARKSNEELNKIFEDFANASDLEFHNQTYLNKLDHFERVQPSDLKTQGIETVKKSMRSASPDDIVLLTTSRSNLADDAESYTKYIFISFFTGAGLLFLLLIYPKYRTENPRKKAKKQEDDLKEMLMFLVPRGNHFITSILIDINIFVFVVLLFFNVDFMNPTAPQLLAFGGANSHLIMNGEPWRLITAMFLHAGMLHILYNMIGLALIGHLIEPILGRKRYLLLYIGSGLISGIAVLLFGKHGVSVGASGAIFGLFAAGFTYALINKIRFLLILIGGYAGSSLLLGFIIPGTDNIGHLGGVAGGILIYFTMREIYPELKYYDEEMIK